MNLSSTIARYKIGAWTCDFATQSITDDTQKENLIPFHLSYSSTLSKIMNELSRDKSL